MSGIGSFFKGLFEGLKALKGKEAKPSETKSKANLDDIFEPRILNRKAKNPLKPEGNSFRKAATEAAKAPFVLVKTIFNWVISLFEHDRHGHGHGYGGYGHEKPSKEEVEKPIDEAPRGIAGPVETEEERKKRLEREAAKKAGEGKGPALRRIPTHSPESSYVGGGIRPEVDQLKRSEGSLNLAAQLGDKTSPPATTPSKKEKLKTY